MNRVFCAILPKSYSWMISGCWLFVVGQQDQSKCKIYLGCDLIMMRVVLDSWMNLILYTYVEFYSLVSSKDKP